MYWLYACWNPHHKHTLHCCTLSSPTLKCLFLLWTSTLIYISIQSWHDGRKKRKKTRVNVRRRVGRDFLIPPRRNEKNFLKFPNFLEIFRSRRKRGGGGRDREGRKEGVEGKIIRKTSINQTSTGIIYVSSTRFFITRHRSPISIYIDLTPKKIIPSKHEEWIARHFRRLQLSTKEALKSICDISKLPHPPSPLRQCVVSPVVRFRLVLHWSSTIKQACSLRFD